MIDAGPGPDGSDGLLSAAQIEALVARIGDNSGGTSVTSRVHGGVYQTSCTLYDALGRDDRAFLLARLLQLFTPGIPQVYYVGLLAGRNVAVPAGADAREINRRRYTDAEVEAALRQPVVRELRELLRLRTEHPAFGGAFTVREAGGELVLEWRHGDATAELRADLARGRWQVSFSGAGAAWQRADADVGVAAPISRG
jgi:sucrose phosphorylase